MKLRTAGFTLILLGFGLSLQAQQSQPLYSYFDKAIGMKNLGINNGPIHLNPFRAYDQSHRYHITDNYFPGDLVYDGQPYTNQNLKYDLFKDVLVTKVNEPNNSLGIELISEKTEWFTFNHKKFVNLGFVKGKPDFVKGYYEEYAATAPFSLYTKYHKDQIEVLTNDGLFYKYQFSQTFLVGYNGSFYRVEDVKDLVRLFPSHENDLKDYAYVNRETEKNDKVQFMKIMADYVNNFIQKDTK